jgi:DNA-binding response OmpR family regulator
MQKNVFRILVIDDDIDLLMLMERKLQQSGYIVESAVSLSEAEYVLSLFKPDLVLIDINVSGEDGRQLCWKIKHTAKTSATKVLLMSGLYYPTNKVMLFGADDFIAKPFPPEFVQQKITAMFLPNEAVQPLRLPVVRME